ncbi:hypothetical protein IJC60_06545 [bacterium]|nr:hypothetical protein [bacterium]
MKIASINKENKQSFKGNFLNSKKLLKVLKFASDKGALVTSGATVAFSAVLRPAVTMLTPDTPDRDKKYAAAKSIASASAVFLTTGLLSGNVNKGLSVISKNTNKYLSPKTIENLKDGAKTLKLSKKYEALEQLIKLSPEALTVIPKLFLTSLLITPIANFFIRDNKDENESTRQINKQGFQGNNGKKTAKILANIINNEKIQNFAGKIKDKKFIEGAIYIKDIIATGVFSGFVKINKTIDQKDKTNLIANTVVSTTLSILGAMSFDKIFEKPLANLSEQFKIANKSDANLEKYLNGARILKSALILGTIYYGIIPMISTYAGSKISNNKYANKQN